MNGESLVLRHPYDKALRNDELDLCVIRPADESVLPERLAGIDDPHCLAVPRGHALAAATSPLDLAASAAEDFVGFSRYQETDFFDLTIALCTSAGFAPRITHEAGQFVNVLEMVACGLGLAIVPWTIATLPHSRHVARKIVFRPIKPIGPPSRLVILQSERLREAAWFANAAGQAVAQLNALESRIAAFMPRRRRVR